MLKAEKVDICHHVGRAKFFPYLFLIDYYFDIFYNHPQYL